jgi:predicted metalloprotease with PDZ domain
LALAVASAAFGLSAHAESSSAPNASIILAQLHAQDVAVEAVGFRLATFNADLCSRKDWHPGFSVHTLEQYGPQYRLAAAKAFALRNRPAVMTVVGGSPADAAGLREGDELIAIDGMISPEADRKPKGADYERTALTQRILRRQFSDGVATLSIMREGARFELVIRAASACPTLFQVIPDAAPNGAADGEYVQVSSSLVALSQSHDELAAL